MSRVIVLLVATAIIGGAALLLPRESVCQARCADQGDEADRP